MIEALITLIAVAAVAVSIFYIGYTCGKLTGICDGLQDAIDILEERREALKEQEGE